MKKLAISLILLVALFAKPSLAQQSNNKPIVIVTVQHQAQITWTASPTSGISGYHVWRTTSLTGAYVQIATLASNVFTYTDQTVKGSTNYYYVVSAFSPLCPATPTCGESSYSNQVIAVIPAP